VLNLSSGTSRRFVRRIRRPKPFDGARISFKKLSGYLREVCELHFPTKTKDPHFRPRPLPPEVAKAFLFLQWLPNGYRLQCWLHLTLPGYTCQNPHTTPALERGVKGANYTLLIELCSCSFSDSQV
jgi:hypothetical protein